MQNEFLGHQLDPDIVGAIPPHTLQSLKSWASKGQPGGHFLRAVLTNDLKEAVSRGDSENLRALVPIVKFLYNYCPDVCWGSEVNYEYWLRKTAPAGYNAARTPTAMDSKP